eukprot:INCI16658.1.p1 GENE.INCI16658.1~~INCI16658.1.p1  ORF type:complete len:383 (-),score=60.38 INCI16658.1:216-1364(-)
MVSLDGEGGGRASPPSISALCKTIKTRAEEELALEHQTIRLRYADLFPQTRKWMRVLRGLYARCKTRADKALVTEAKKPVKLLQQELSLPPPAPAPAPASGGGGAAAAAAAATSHGPECDDVAGSRSSRLHKTDRTDFLISRCKGPNQLELNALRKSSDGGRTFFVDVLKKSSKQTGGSPSNQNAMVEFYFSSLARQCAKNESILAKCSVVSNPKQLGVMFDAVCLKIPKPLSWKSPPNLGNFPFYIPSSTGGMRWVAEAKLRENELHGPFLRLAIPNGFHLHLNPSLGPYNCKKTRPVAKDYHGGGNWLELLGSDVTDVLREAIPGMFELASEFLSTLTFTTQVILLVDGQRLDVIFSAANIPLKFIVCFEPGASDVLLSS